MSGIKRGSDWVPVAGADNDPYGSLFERHTSEGGRWLRFETGPAIGILPIIRVDGRIRVLLIQEEKPILKEDRLKVATDYLRSRPNNPDTAREILAQKTGIQIGGTVVQFFETIPGYDPTVAFNISLYLGDTWMLPPDGEETSQVTPIALDLNEAVDLVLRDEIMDIFSVYVLLLLDAMERHGKLNLNILWLTSE